MRTKIEALKEKVLNRAEIARRWFKLDDVDAVRFVAENHDVARALDDPEIMKALRLETINRILDAEAAGDTTEFRASLGDEFVDAVLASAAKWRALHGDSDGGASA